MNCTFKNVLSYLLLILANVVVSACKNQDTELYRTEKRDNVFQVLTISEAQRHFETMVIPSSRLDVKKGQGSANPLFSEFVNSKNAIWGQALTRKVESGTAITVPMDFARFRFRFDEKMNAVVDENSLNYLMMYRDQHGEIQSEWVTLIPDKDWLQDSYRKYSGRVLVRDWQGNFRHGYSFDKNNQSKIYKPAGAEQANAKVTDTMIGQFCYSVTFSCGNRTLSYLPGQCTIDNCVPVVVETPPGGASPVPTTGGMTPAAPGNGLGGGGVQNPGANYIPNECNPNLPSGTQVAPNQLPPCSMVSPVIPAMLPGFKRIFTSLQDIITDSELEKEWNSIPSQDKNFFSTGDNWKILPAFLINVGITKAAGAAYFKLPDLDNTNANAFRHMLLSGLNSLAWGSEQLAKQFGEVHEQGPGSPNQHSMDLTNNEEGLKLARVYKNPISLISAISNYMKTPDTKAVRTQMNLPNGTLIKTSGSERTAFGNTH